MRATTIIIGIPAYKGALSAETLASLADVSKYSTRFNADPVIIPRIIPNAYCNCYGRNKAIYNGNYRPSWKPDFDYFFSTDCDMEFTPVLIRQLAAIAREHRNRCIVSAAYINRHIDKQIVAGTYADDGRAQGNITPADYMAMFADGQEFRRVGWCGMGACLIPAGLIMEFPAPFFRHEYFTNPLNGELEELQDDLALCFRLRAANIPVLLTKYRVRHNGKGIE